MTYDELLAIARELQDQPLETVTGRLFTVGVYLDSLVFTPASSGIGQSDGRKAAERFSLGTTRPEAFVPPTTQTSPAMPRTWWVSSETSSKAGETRPVGIDECCAVRATTPPIPCERPAHRAP